MESMVKNSDGTITIDGKIYEERKPAIQATDTETKEVVFSELVKDLIRKEDREKYPNSVFWFNKRGQFMFEHDEVEGYFWCSYPRVWSVFEKKFGMNFSEIQTFMNGKVEEHFKCKGITTVQTLISISVMVEEHFKCKGITTNRLLGGL